MLTLHFIIIFLLQHKHVNMPAVRAAYVMASCEPFFIKYHAAPARLGSDRRDALA